MLEALGILIVIAVIVVIIVIRNNNSLKGELRQSKSQLEWTSAFVHAVSDATKGIQPDYYNDAFRCCDVDNAGQVTSIIDFIYAVNSASKTLQEAEANCEFGSVASQAAHIRAMVKDANVLALTVNEMLGINASTMLLDLAKVEHTGNVSDVRNSVGVANETLRKIFGEFQKVNDKMAMLNVSREEAGISDTDPLANFLDTAQSIADMGSFETKKESNETEDNDSDTNQ